MVGTSSKEGRSSSSTQYEQNPWENSIHALTEGITQLRTGLSQTGLSSRESSALDSLYNNASQGNPYAGDIDALAKTLLSGGTDRSGAVQGNYDWLRSALMPYATSETDPYKNAAFTKATGYMSDDIANRIKSQYVGAGYSPVSSGDFSKQMGEGISRGVAPTWLQAHNDMEARKLGAISGIYSAGNTTQGLLHGMDQDRYGRQLQGVTTARDALNARDAPYMRQLEIEMQRRGIPQDRLNQIMSTLIQTGQLGGSGTSNSQGFQSQTSRESWTDSLQKITGSLGNLFGSGGMFGRGSSGGAFSGGW